MNAFKTLLLGLILACLIVLLFQMHEVVGLLQGIREDSEAAKIQSENTRQEWKDVQKELIKKGLINGGN